MGRPVGAKEIGIERKIRESEFAAELFGIGLTCAIVNVGLKKFLSLSQIVLSFQTLLSGEEFIMNTAEVVQEACNVDAKKPDRLLDIRRAVQQNVAAFQTTPLMAIAEARGSAGRGGGPVTFYAFPLQGTEGPCRDPDLQRHRRRYVRRGEVAKVFSEELGIPVGATTPDGKISLEYTACIGMSDQAPATW